MGLHAAHIQPGSPPTSPRDTAPSSARRPVLDSQNNCPQPKQTRAESHRAPVPRHSPDRALPRWRAGCSHSTKMCSLRAAGLPRPSTAAAWRAGERRRTCHQLAPRMHRQRLGGFERAPGPPATAAAPAAVRGTESSTAVQQAVPTPFLQPVVILFKHQPAVHPAARRVGPPKGGRHQETGRNPKARLRPSWSARPAQQHVCSTICSIMTVPPTSPHILVVQHIHKEGGLGGQLVPHDAQLRYMCSTRERYTRSRKNFKSNCKQTDCAKPDTRRAASLGLEPQPTGTQAALQAALQDRHAFSSMKQQQPATHQAPFACRPQSYPPRRPPRLRRSPAHSTVQSRQRWAAG